MESTNGILSSAAKAAQEPTRPTCGTCPYWNGPPLEEGNKGLCHQSPQIISTGLKMHRDSGCGDHPDFPAFLTATRPTTQHDSKVEPARDTLLTDMDAATLHGDYRRLYAAVGAILKSPNRAIGKAANAALADLREAYAALPEYDPFPPADLGCQHHLNKRLANVMITASNVVRSEVVRGPNASYARTLTLVSGRDLESLAQAIKAPEPNESSRIGLLTLDIGPICEQTKKMVEKLIAEHVTPLRAAILNVLKSEELHPLRENCKTRWSAVDSIAMGRLERAYTGENDPLSRPSHSVAVTWTGNDTVIDPSFVVPQIEPAEPHEVIANLSDTIKRLEDDLAKNRASGQKSSQVQATMDKRTVRVDPITTLARNRKIVDEEEPDEDDSLNFHEEWPDDYPCLF